MAMDFLDKLSAKMTNAGRTVSQSARNFSDTNSLKREITNEKRNIQQKYAQIGQLYYEKYNNDPGCEFFEEVDSILTSMRHIESLESEIQEVQARRPELLPVPDTTKPAEPRVRPSAMVCMQCGQTYDTTQIFCANCGQKLTPQYPTAAAAAIAPEQTAADVTSAAPATPAEAPAPETPEAAETKQSGSETPANANAAHFCPNCGAQAPSDSVFCAQCGTKLA